MSFRNKYELHWVVLDGPVKTFGAKEIVSGRPVFLHLLTDEKGVHQQSFLQKIRSLKSVSAAGGAFPILEVNEAEGTPYIVTDVLEPFTTLEDWVEEQAKQGHLEVEWQLRLKRSVADRTRRLGETITGAASAAWEPARQIRRLTRKAADGLQQQILALRVKYSPSRPSDGAIESDPEKYALWCLATAHRLRMEGDLQTARVVAGHGLARYRARTRKQEEQAALVRPQTEVAPVSEAAEAEPIVPALTGLAWAWRKPLQAAAAALAAFAPDGRILKPVALGAAAATMTVAVGWLGWSIYNGPPQDQAERLASRRVEIQSSVPGAVISINGEECGVSTCQVDLAPGTYETEAQLAGYEPASGSFEIGDQALGQGDPLVLELRALAPVLRVSSDLTAGEVFVDGQPAGRLEDGEFELELSSLDAGEHTLLVKHGASEAAVTFQTAPGTMPVVRGPVESRNLQAAVVAGLGSKARIYSQAEAGQARMIRTSLGNVRPDGLEWTDLAPGSHEVTLPGGEEVVFDSGPNPTLAVFLKAERNFGGLQIATGEDDAIVYLNGKKYRKKTRRGNLVAYLRPGEYRVRVEKEGFQSPPEQLVTIRKGDRARLDFPLTPVPRMASLRIKNGLPGTEVLVDGVSRGTIGLDGGLVLSDLGPGQHGVLLRRELHKPRRFEREFAAGDTIEVEGLLESALATLRVQVGPPDAEPRITLRREGETIDRVITDRTLNLAEGTYTIKASAPGYETTAASVHLAGNQIRTAELNLVPDQAENRAVVELADWEDRRGWSRQGRMLVRRGGDVVLSPVDPAEGTYEFTAILKRGRRLEWIVNYIDDKNYALYQFGKNYLHRIQVIDGVKSAPLRIGHPLDPDEFIRVKIEVSSDSVIHKILQNGEWAVIDRWVHTGAGFARGSFGFHIPNRHEIGLRNFTFVPQTSDHKRSTGL